MRGRLGVVRAAKIVGAGLILPLISLVVALIDPATGSVVTFFALVVIAVGLLILLVVGFVSLATWGEPRK